MKFDQLKREPLMQEIPYQEAIQFTQKSYINNSIEEVFAEKERDQAHKKRLSWAWTTEAFELLI